MAGGVGVKVNLEDVKKIKAALGKLQTKEKRIIRTSLSEGILIIHRKAFENLTGPKKPPGQFPVNINTGFLRRNQYFVLPGKTKTSNEKIFRAEPFEAIAGNSANYAGTVHEGVFTTKDGQILNFIFGRRPYLEKAADSFGREIGLIKLIKKNLRKAIKASGLT